MKFLGIITALFSVNTALAGVPQWVSEIGPCGPLEICVVGSGSSLKEANAEGRSELSKFFETKVQVQNTVSQNTSTINESINKAKSFEWTSKNIIEEADEILSGVEIKKSIEVDGTYYALLSLQKEIVAKTLKEKIEQIDHDNVSLFENNSRFAYPMIYLNLKKRDYLNARYNLVSSTEIKTNITTDKLLARINQMPPMKMALVSEGEKLPLSYSQMLERIVSPLKIIFVSKKANPEQILKSKIVFEEQYLKVTGFKKLNVILKLALHDKKNNILGRLSATSIQTARSKENARDLALNDIENQIRENLVQLASDKIGVNQ